MDDDWDDITTQKSGGQWYPAEPMVRLTARFIQRRTGIDSYDVKRPTDRVLDVGCGNGSHVLFFAEQGLSAAGVDISKPAIELGRQRAAETGLDVDFKTGDAADLSWGSETFDLVVSDGVLDHVSFSEAKSILAEIQRVSTPDAYIFLSLRSTADSECGRGEEVEENTYILKEGYEKGMLQHFFDRRSIEELLEGYEIFDIEHLKREYPADFSVDKSHLQSSEGLKKQIDLRDTDFSRQHARWWIAARRTK
ncbi:MULTISPECIES: class I SAM-dependent methyltransferase [Halomicrobium]|uniref:Methyltransferase type 11 n=2 Tax=Halomicrobium mukohataei TaxID=57705 RepID=C7P3A6_HALMD|nr:MULTISPECIES: class I SAM-dependent methyltransferase [Halomicrobium]ACV47578.1 Methyltransferase type 11 [Halomicrobium mukohataei DSM 12286]QCD66041.1 class I SAM-dependent methyltransferase [Halomicrobium mukohataei]QFR20846.1 methyltransferase domain-containing protein [Halomicrobium sp. ZPS1]